MADGHVCCRMSMWNAQAPADEMFSLEHPVTLAPSRSPTCLSQLTLAVNETLSGQEAADVRVLLGKLWF